MPALKRKRLQDEEQSKLLPDENSRTRRVTRQISILPPPLPVPPKPTSQGRSSRANPTAVANPQDGTRVKARGRGRPRREPDTAAAQAGQEPDREDSVTRRGKRGDNTTSTNVGHQRKARKGRQPESSAAASERKTRRSAKTSDTVPDSEAEVSSADSTSGKEEDREEGEEGGKENGDDEEAEDGEKEAEAVSRTAPSMRRPKRSAAPAVATAPAARMIANKTSPLTADGKEPSFQTPVEASRTEIVFNHISSSPTTTQLQSATEIQPASVPLQNRTADATSVLSPASIAAQEQKQPLLSPKLLKSGLASMSPATNVPAVIPGRRASQSTSSVGSSLQAPAPPPGSGQPDRNIDKVVLGKICFRAWYPSYYGKEVLGETAGSTHHGKGHPTSAHSGQGSGKDSHHGAHRNPQPILDRLYVCPWCFKYSKEIVPWWGHVQACERQFQIPGEKVYVHPKGIRTVRVPVQPTPKTRRRRGGGEPEVQYVEQVVKDEGEWSIWEVDGEKDGLFCQNLSLFAKLFLDNKSVFFDVTGFNYFLLVYTPPPPTAETSTTTSDGLHAKSAEQEGVGSLPRSRVIGFFSKEKMSWDNNNLACILVFPPWQRKGLGALLMGISYEISRREEVLGGPEKPISDLGKKGYKRFWAGEIARWLLSLTVPSEQSSSQSGDGSEEKALVIDIADCSRATYIAQEDCLLVLREMGVVEDAGMGPPKSQYRNTLLLSDEPGAGLEGRSMSPAPELTGGGKAAPAALVPVTGAVPPTASGVLDGGTAPAPALSEKQDVPKEVQRIRIAKAAVRRWVAKNRISLEKACDPAGFIKIYSKKDLQQTTDE